MKPDISTKDLLEALEQSKSIENFISDYNNCFVDISFKEYLDNMLTLYGLKKATVIKASQLSETYAYQIFSGLKNPSRDKLVALAVGMGLNLDECQKLLYLANVNVLYPKNRRDAVIIFGINKKLSIPEINDILFEVEEFTL